MRGGVSCFRSPRRPHPPRTIKEHIKITPQNRQKPRAESSEKKSLKSLVVWFISLYNRRKLFFRYGGLRMSKKYQILKRFLKISGLLSGLLLVLMVGAPASSHGMFDWFFSLFSSSSKAASLTSLKIALYDGNKLDQRQPDAEIEMGSIQKPTVLVLWTLGCGPCLKELALLNKLAKQIRDSGGEVVSVLLAPDWAPAVSFLAKAGRRWNEVFGNLPTYYDRHGHIQKALDVRAAPMIVFLDASGAVLESQTGSYPWTFEEIQEKLKMSKANPKDMGPNPVPTPSSAG